jgi:taurine transport system ATP-binding protein
LDVRTQIARALAADADVLLVDEPFGVGGDPEREHLQQYLHSIWTQTGKTLVLASRDAAHVVPLATRVIALSPGPGDIIKDVHVDFAQRYEPSGALLSDPDVARFTARLRVA